MYDILVGPRGFEPRMTEPKPVVLPLHHDPGSPLLTRAEKAVFLRVGQDCYKKEAMRSSIGLIFRIRVPSLVANHRTVLPVLPLRI